MLAGMVNSWHRPWPWSIQFRIMFFFFSSFVSIFCNRFVTVISVDDMVFFHISLFVTLSHSLYHSLDVPLSPSRTFFFISNCIGFELADHSTNVQIAITVWWDRTYFFVHASLFLHFILWISICLLNLIRMLHNFAEII